MLHESPITLEWVPAGEHTVDDLRLVEEADNAQPLIDRIPLAEIDEGLRQGKMQMFRVVPGPGVMLTEVIEQNGTKRLYLLRGAGRCAWQMRAILKLLGKTAKEWGCERVETVVYSQRLKRALELSGAEVEGYVLSYALENSDGQ